MLHHSAVVEFFVTVHDCLSRSWTRIGLYSASALSFSI